MFRCLTHNKLKRSASILGTLLMSMFLVNCTEKRPERLDQSQRESFVNRAHIDSTVVRIKTAGETNVPADNHLAIYERPSYPVAEHNAPAEYAFMFHDLMVQAQPNTEYDVVFKTQKGSLRAYIVIEDAQNLTQIQYANLERYGDTGKYLVPIFSYNVVGYGRKEAVLNDLEEATNRVRLARTSWESAEWIEINKSPSERQLLTVASGDMRTTGERVFVEAYLRGAVTDKATLARDYDISLNSADDAVLYTTVSGDKLLIYEVTTLNSDGIDDGHRQIIANGVQSSLVTNCSAETQGQISVPEGDQCVHLLRYKVDVDHVRAQQVPNWTDENGQVASYSTVVTFESAEPSEQPGLIRIARNPLPQEVTVGDGIELDPRTYLPVAELREGEFLYRRMLQDVPNSAPGLFATMTGPINIIKFRFLEDRVEGYRTDATQRNAVNNPTDFETLFTIPATYYRRVYNDAAGRALPTPRLVETTSSDTSPDVFVKMDWTKNQLVDSGSPMSPLLPLGFGQGLCFGASYTNVSDVDNRLGSDGVISFTVEGQYSVNPLLALACFGQFAGVSGYSNMWGTDGNFAINERISIKKHNPEHDNFESLDLPVLAQKAFNFGAVSRSYYNPTASGRTGLVGMEKNLAIIHDFEKGPVTYVLKGVPERLAYGDGSEYVTREEMVDAVREVIADWNDVLRKSFKGTPLETNRDLLLLKVDGVDIHTKIGDLDVNHIYVEASATGVPYLGVYMGTPNPRSGLYEAGNVNVFAGNIMASAENTQWASRIKKQYLDDYRAAMTAAERMANQAQQQQQGQQPGPLGLNRSRGGDASTEDLAQAQGYINSLTATIADIAPKMLYSEFSLTPNSAVVGQMPIVGAADVAALDQMNPMLENNLGRLADVADRMGRAGTLNLSEVVGQYTHLFPGAEESGMLWIQKGMDVALEDVAKFGSNPMFFERGFIGAYLESHGSELQPFEANQLNHRLSQLNIQYLSQYGPAGSASCFYESMDLGSEVLAGMPTRELFLSMFKHTTSHELGHALGLAHNFKGSVDGNNFNFPGEEDSKRLSSSIMEYGQALERAYYSGPGPYDVHALRAIYTGLVEVDPRALETVQGAAQVGEDGRKYVPVGTPTGQMVPLWLYGDQFVQIDQMIDYFTPKGSNPKRLSELDVEAMQLPVRHYEYCTNGFEYFDPTCNMFDAGTNGPEIVDYFIGQYNASYEFQNLIHDRANYTIYNMFRNIGRTAWTFNHTRRFMDDAMFRLVNRRGTAVFSRQGNQPQSYQEYRALDSYFASMKARSFLLSVLHTPDADGYTNVRQRLKPEVIGLQGQNGQVQPVPVVIERKWLWARADNDYGSISQTPYYLDKILALNFLTQRSASRDLEGDILALRAFSFLDFERYYMGIDSIEKSQVGRSLAQLLSEDLMPMFIPTEGSMFMAPLGVEYLADIPNSLRFYAGLNAILSLYVNAIQEDYNFGADFMVFREHGAGKLAAGLDSGSYLVDLSRDVNASNVPKYFAYEGEYSKVASILVQQGSFLREVMEGDISEKMVDFAAARMNLVLGDELSILELPAEDLRLESDAGIQEGLAKKSQYEKVRNQLSSSIASVMGSEEEAARQVSVVESFIDTFLGVAPQIGPMAEAGQYQVISQVIQQLGTLGRRNPFLVMAAQGIESALTSSTPKVDMTLVNFAPVALQILPSTVDLEVRYGMIRGNVDLLNRFTSILEPSARAN